MEGVKKIRLDKRIYEDETPVFANEAPKRGRARRGHTHPSGAISLRQKRTRCMYTQSGVLHWDLSDRTCMQTPKRLTRVAIDAVGAMKSGETVIWDRLGRSGACCESEQPAPQPGGERSIRERGVSIKFLPPKDKYFNPLELLFNDLKQHDIRPNFPKKRSTAVQVKDCRAYSRVCR